MPKTISNLAEQFLRDPVQVSVTPVASTAERVEQQVIFVSTQQKQAMLERVLNSNAIERTLIFTRTKHGADRVVKHLGRAGINAAAIHGNKSQAQRERALGAFRTGDNPILIATDIAARGIDVDGVSHVINFDLPNVPESYVHRIGRTARAGAEGLAISFCNSEERAYLRDIERLIRQRIFVVPTPTDLAVTAYEPNPETFTEGDRKHGGGRRQENSRRPAAPASRSRKPSGATSGARTLAKQDGRPAQSDNRNGAPSRPGAARNQRPSGPAAGRSDNRQRRFKSGPSR